VVAAVASGSFSWPCQDGLRCFHSNSTCITDSCSACSHIACSNILSRCHSASSSALRTSALQSAGRRLCSRHVTCSKNPAVTCQLVASRHVAITSHHSTAQQQLQRSGCSTLQLHKGGSIPAACVAEQGQPPQQVQVVPMLCCCSLGEWPRYSAAAGTTTRAAAAVAAVPPPLPPPSLPPPPPPHPPTHTRTRGANRPQALALCMFAVQCTGLVCFNGRTASWLTSAWPSLIQHQATSPCSTQTGADAQELGGGGVSGF
jgi:hypothetical protein